MTSGTLLITGASGYLGGHLVGTALDKGYNVRATARSESSAKKIIDQFPQYKAQLSTAIVPDMTDAKSYEHHLEGVVGILHSASPFVLKPEDNVKDLLEPAIHGSVAILEAAKQWGPSVRRVVITSSHASVCDLGKGKRPGYVYDEKDWNPVTFEEAAVADGVVAYCASKALAEKAAWDWVAKNEPKFDLVTITPPWIFGPYVTELTNTKGISESLQLLYGIIGATEVPPFDFGGFADAREVAAAHVLGFEVPEAGGQRFWVGQNFNYQSAVDAAREQIPELRSRMPVGQPGVVEDTYTVDGSKATRVLGLKYRTLAETVKDTYEQLLRAEAAEAK
ncbi:NAD dependent epimerase/dehydratase [Ilyonectria robusta]